MLKSEYNEFESECKEGASLNSFGNKRRRDATQNSRISKTAKSKSNEHNQVPSYAQHTENSLKRIKSKKSEITLGSSQPYKLFKNPESPKKKDPIGLSVDALTYMQSEIEESRDPSRSGEKKKRENILHIDAGSLNLGTTNRNQNNQTSTQSTGKNKF